MTKQLTLSLSGLLLLLLLLYSRWVVSDFLGTTWTGVRQTPLFMGFPSKNSGVGMSFSSPRDLPNPGI